MGTKAINLSTDTLTVGLIAGEQDADTLTEVFWAALHGLVSLGRAGRLRPEYESDRLRLLVEQFVGS